MPRRIRLEDVRIKSGGETPLVAPTMNWDESEHPRDEDGQFTEKGGGSTGGKSDRNAFAATKGEVDGAIESKKAKLDELSHQFAKSALEDAGVKATPEKIQEFGQYAHERNRGKGVNRMEAKDWKASAKEYAKKIGPSETKGGTPLHDAGNGRKVSVPPRDDTTGSPAKGSDPFERAHASGMAKLYEKALQPRKSGDNPSRGERNIRMRVDAMKTAITRVFPKTRTEQLTGRDYSDLESMSKKLFGGRGFSQLGKAEQDKVVYKQSKAWKRDAYR